MVAIFYIFLEHCVTCCSKIISCGKFSLNIWNRFFIRGIREQQFVLLYKLRFSKIHKLTLCVKKKQYLNFMYEISQQKPCKKMFFSTTICLGKKIMYGHRYLACTTTNHVILLFLHWDLFEFFQIRKDTYILEIKQDCISLLSLFFRYRFVLSYDMWSSLQYSIKTSTEAIFSQWVINEICQIKVQKNS